MMKKRRKWIQLICAVLYNCNFTGFFDGTIYQGKIKGLCVPGLNCYSCPGAVASCPIGSLQSALVSSKYKFPYYILGMLLLFGLFLGRIVCGFLCPFGWIQELLHKIPTKKVKKNKWTKRLTPIKYVVLLVFVVIMPLTTMVPGFCKYICPAGTLEAGILLTAMNENLRELLGSLFFWKVLVMALILVSTVFLFRSFCRFFCPLGAFYGLFHQMSFWGISVDEQKCDHCKACVKMCQMDIKKPGDMECIQCGECVDICHCHAISFGRKTCKKREK